MFLRVNTEWEIIICSSGPTFEVAFIETLLAMKVCSDRHMDVPDTRLLLQGFGLEGSPESAIDNALRIYKEDPVNFNHNRNTTSQRYKQSVTASWPYTVLQNSLPCGDHPGKDRAFIRMAEPVPAMRGSSGLP